MLKRFAAQVPDAPFPKEISDLTGQQQMRLAEADPELFAVMSGTATASLEASVMDGTFADSVTPLAEREEQARNQEVEQLIADGAFPSKGHYNGSEYVAGRSGNLTAQLRILALSPQRYESEKLKANPPQPNENAVSAESAARMNAELAATRIQSLNSPQGAN